MVLSGYFDQEIVSVSVPGRKGATTLISKDENPRPETTKDTLGKLRPAFIKVFHLNIKFSLENLLCVCTDSILSMPPFTTFKLYVFARMAQEVLQLEIRLLLTMVPLLW